MRQVYEILVQGLLAWATSPEGTIVLLGWLAAVGAAVKMWLTARATARGRAATRALDIAERAAGAVYDEFVLAWKEAAADGKITPDEIKRARGLAVERAIAFGRAEGFDIVKEIGYEALPRLVNAAVGRLKARAVPASVER